MSLATYADLQNQTLSFLHRASLLDAVGASNVPDLILLGEKWLFRKARTREMEAALSVTLASGVGTVPSDYADLKHARLDGSPTRHLKLRPTRFIMENYPLRSTSGKPFFIGVDGSTFIFGPFPDSNYSLLGIYYAKPTSIQSSANALFVASPDAYLYAALAMAELYVKNDKRVAGWIALRDRTVADMNAEAKDAGYDDMVVAVG